MPDSLYRLASKNFFCQNPQIKFNGRFNQRTKVKLWEKSHLLKKKSNAGDDIGPEAAISPTIVEYNLYDIVFCDGDLIHAGLGFDTTEHNYRLHMYGDKQGASTNAMLKKRVPNKSYFITELETSKIKT